MSEFYDTIEKDGLICNIMYDYNPENPRSWECNLCRFVTPERSRVASEVDLGLEWYCREDDEARLDADEDVLAWRTLYCFEHGAISYSIFDYRDRWDSGAVGYVVVMKDDVLRCFGKIPEDIETKAIEWMKAEVEEFSNYANGDVYGFLITTEDGEELDSCCGFYGDGGLETIKEEFDGWIKHMAKERRRQREEDNSLLVASGIDVDLLYV